METIRYDNKTLTLDYPAQLDNYRGGIAWYATAPCTPSQLYRDNWSMK